MSVIKYLKLHRFLLAHLVCWHFVHVFLNRCTEKVKEQWFHKIGVESKRAIKCNNLNERVDKIYIWRRFWVAMEAVDGAIETWDPASEGRLVTDCCLICSCMAATISCIWIGKTKITPVNGYNLSHQAICHKGRPSISGLCGRPPSLRVDVVGVQDPKQRPLYWYKRPLYSYACPDQRRWN